MTIVAHNYRYVIGVDTHSRTHTYAVVADSGEHIATETFPNTHAGINRAISWAARRAADPATIWSVEGAASYGSALTAHLTTTGKTVVEAPRISKRARRGLGKSDPIDARVIASTALVTPIDKLRQPRTGDGARQALRILLAARSDITRETTKKKNALTALLRKNELGIDARRKPGPTEVKMIAAWRTRSEPIDTDIARHEARRLAQRVIELDNEHHLTDLLRHTPAAALLEVTGIGPIAAAVALPSGHTTDGSKTRPRSQRSRVSAPSRHPAGTRPATG